MADVVLENVSKNFGGVKAVDNVSLRIADKEFMVFLGPSGSGKTTTMRLIAGLETLTEGRILIGDRIVNDLPAGSRDVAMVFQSYALYPHMSVYDNLAFPLQMRKFTKSKIAERVKQTAEMLQIGELLRRKPRQLSGGQQQRVALGRALVREPKVFLMDEPLSNLDAKLRLHMRAELKSLQRRLGITTIYVTHDQIEAMSMADRIALLDRGCLLQTATPDEIYRHPASEFVAGFIGSPPMNFLECTLSEKDDRLFAVTSSWSIDVTDLRELLQQKIGDEVILGVRPEDTSIAKEKPSRDAISGEIYVVEPLGSELIVDVKLGKEMVRAREISSIVLSFGERVWVSFNISKTHIFDKKTGATLV